MRTIFTPKVSKIISLLAILLSLLAIIMKQYEKSKDMVSSTISPKYDYVEYDPLDSLFIK